MNRHIYGLTLFLVIVKVHFLLYWAFFAPVNFFTKSEVVKSPVIIAADEPSYKCNRAKKREAVLQNAAIDFKNQTVSANVRFNDLQTAFDSNEFAAYLRISGGKIDETIVLKPNYSVEAGKVVSFKGELPAGANWNPKANYWSEIDFVNLDFPQAASEISTIKQSVPVLIIREQHR